MKARLFNPQSDYERLMEWWSDRHQPISTVTELPPVGFINDEAACFLVQTDAQVAFLDNLISTGVQSDTRSQAIDEVVTACIEFAKDKGYRNVAALTEMDSVYERAVQSHGFKWISVYHLLTRSFK